MSETPKARGRGRPKTLKTADVAQTAMKAYWAHGPTEVSLNAICQQAGVSKPSVYRAFGNDDGLAHAALATYAETVLNHLSSIILEDDGFFSKIRRITYLTTEDALHEQGCLFVKMRAVRSQLGPKTQDLIAQIESQSIAALTEVLAKARAEGAWPGDIPVDLGARYLQAQIGLAMDQRARGEDPKATMALALSVFEVAGPAEGGGTV